MQSDGRVNAIQDTEELRYWATGTRSLEQGRVNDCAVVRQQIAKGVVIYGAIIKRESLSAYRRLFLGGVSRQSVDFPAPTGGR